MKKQDALKMVFERNAFYRRLYFFALSAFSIAAMVIVVLSFFLVYLIKNPRGPLFFATDTVGRLIHIIPTNTPNMDTNKVIQWAEDAVTAAYSYDYVNYHGQLQDTQKYFTNYGWFNYMRALTASNNLLALTQRRQIILAQVVDQPKILAAGILSGAYAWKLQMSLLVNYWQPPYSSVAYNNALQVTVIVQREPELQSYKGLGVVEFVAGMPLSSIINKPAVLSNTPAA